jgi:phosphoadenosine phosphosulfate reductase
MKTRPVESGIDPDIRAKAIGLTAETALASIEWARQEFGTGLCLLASMQDAVMIDLVMRVDRSIPVVFLDNGYHFDQTLQTLAAVEARYDIDVEVVGPRLAPGDIESGRCCDLKAPLLLEALEGRTAWMSGIRRVETEVRAGAELVEIDRRGLFKINPIAQWADRDVDAYIEQYDVIVNPLLSEGYTSIGCRTCTTPAGSTGGRSGRWAGTGRTECGLHR